MRLLALTLLCTLCLTARAATTITGGVLAASDTTGTNARPSAVTITARTNLASGTLQVTNVVTLGAGATAATLQTDTNGTIQATSAASGTNDIFNLNENALQVFGDGGLMLGTNTPAIWGGPLSGEALVKFSDVSQGEPDNFGVYLGSNNGDASASFSAYGNTSGTFIAMDGNDGVSAGHRITMNAGVQFGYIDIHNLHPYALLYLADPTKDDGQTPYLFDTSVAHTSGNLVEVKNNGTNVWSNSSEGSMLVGRNTANFWGPPAGYETLISYRDARAGDIDGIYWLIEAQSSATNYAIATITGDSTAVTYSGQVSIGSGVFRTAQVSSSTSGLSISLTDGAVTRLSLDPLAADGTTAFVHDTSVVHTSGNIGAYSNNGTNIVQITATTATSTNTPFILNINGTQKPVWLGPVDSGGTGLRALTVAN